MSIFSYSSLRKNSLYSFIALFFVLGCILFPQSITHLEAQQVSGPGKFLSAGTKNYFASTTIQARSAYVIDLKNHQVLFEKNAFYARPLASITKIMTAITAAGIAPTSTVITITPNSLSEDGNSGFLHNEQWNLKNLLSYMLVTSSNDGAAAVAQALGSQEFMHDDAESESQFVSRMNFNARRLGLSQTRFNNATGLDESKTVAGAYGSARDVATLLGYAINTYPGIVVSFDI